jgi:hypothetical protein
VCAARVAERRGGPPFYAAAPADTAAIVGARSPAEIGEDVGYLGMAVPDVVFDELADSGLIPANDGALP